MHLAAEVRSLDAIWPVAKRLISVRVRSLADSDSRSRMSSDDEDDDLLMSTAFTFRTYVIRS